MLSLPPVRSDPARWPRTVLKPLAVLKPPPTLFWSALSPVAVSSVPQVLKMSVLIPRAVLSSAVLLVNARADSRVIVIVRYDQVNAMLFNEFLKEHRKNEEQGATIAGQQTRIDALTAGLQKVSAQLEATRSIPEFAASDR